MSPLRHPMLLRVRGEYVLRALAQRPRPPSTFAACSDLLWHYTTPGLKQRYLPPRPLAPILPCTSSQVGAHPREPGSPTIRIRFVPHPFPLTAASDKDRLLSRRVVPKRSTAPRDGRERHRTLARNAFPARLRSSAPAVPPLPPRF